MPNTPLQFVFFGTDQFSIAVLNQLEQKNLLPQTIVAPPDKPKGRKLRIIPPPIKEWAKHKNVPIFQPERLDQKTTEHLKKTEAKVFIVASYGKIIPKGILDIPKYGVINVHPSLLPKYRGPSPIQTQILHNEKEFGVSIMLLDEEMDHGPLLAKRAFPNEGQDAPTLTEFLGNEGGKLLAEVLLEFVERKISPVTQEEGAATYTVLIKKEDGRIELSDDPEKNYRKYLALRGWPGTYFFFEQNGKKIRTLIKEAYLEKGVFVPKRVIPEGGKEMFYDDFLRGFRKN